MKQIVCSKCNVALRLGHLTLQCRLSEFNSKLTKHLAQSHVREFKPIRMGLAYKKDGVARQYFSNKTLRCTKILFCRRGLKRFSLLRCTNSYITLYLLSYFFGSIPLKPPSKAPVVELSMLTLLEAPKPLFKP